MIARIIPPNMPFDVALRLGYAGEIRLTAYLAWVKTLDCDTCGATGPCDPSHPNFFKSQVNKAPDPLALPECRSCHELYENIGAPDQARRLARAAIYLLRAIYEGRLKWVNVPG